jgi:hypothetical protein
MNGKYRFKDLSQQVFDFLDAPIPEKKYISCVKCGLIPPDYVTYGILSQFSPYWSLQQAFEIPIGWTNVQILCQHYLTIDQPYAA